MRPFAHADRALFRLGRRGLNEQTRKEAGSVVFAVAAKDGPQFNTRVLRGGQAPVKIDLDTHGAKTLYLEVGDAGDGPVFDYADWADAVLTLQGGRTVRLDELARAGFDCVKFGSEWSSSNQDLPFFNIETPESRGVLVGFGWTGNWQAEFTGSGTQLARPGPACPRRTSSCTPAKKSAARACCWSSGTASACTATTCSAACSTTITCRGCPAASRTSRR